MNNIFIFGQWDKQNKTFVYNTNKIKALQERNAGNMKHCKSCEAKLHCAGYCLGEVMNETGSLYGQKAHTCKAIKTLYKELGVCETYDYMHP
jgi:radical SAM protein with 4Fe4S-binding SPASM domain